MKYPLNAVQHEPHVQPRTVVIEGPAGVGKTTQSKLVAERLGYTNLTTGMLFCAGSIAVQRSGLNSGRYNADEIYTLLQQTHIDFDLEAGKDPRLSIDGDDVSDHLLTRPISTGLQKFAVYNRLVKCWKLAHELSAIAVIGSAIVAVACFPMPI